MEKTFPDLLAALRHCLKLHQAGDLVAAEEGYRQLFRLTPNHPDVLRLYAALLTEQNRASESLPLLQALCRLQPEDGTARSALGYCQLSLQDLAGATQTFRHMSLANPQEADPWINLASLYLRQDQVAEALHAARRAVELAPESVEAQHNLGVALWADGQMSAAYDVLRQTVAQRPDWTVAWMQLGQVCLARGLAAEALAALRVASLRGREAGLLIAEAATLAGRHDLASALYQQELMHSPQDWERRQLLANSIAAQGAMEEALAVLSEEPPASLRDSVRLQRIGLLHRLGRDAVAYRLLRTLPQEGLAWYLRAAELREALPAQDRPAVRAGLVDCLTQSAGHQSPEAASAWATLAAEAEAVGDDSSAATFFQQGQRSCAHVLPFDRQHWQQCLGEIRSLAAGLLQQESLAPETSAEVLPIFVVGLPGSGSDWIAAEIAHWAAVPRYDGAGDVADLVHAARFCGADPAALLRWRAAYRQRLQHAAGDAAWVCDASADLYLYLPWLRWSFPHAPLVFCRRDPADNALLLWQASLSRALPAYTHDWQALATVCREHYQLVWHWQHILAGPFFEVVYEEVRSDPHAMKTIVTAMGVTPIQGEPAHAPPQDLLSSFLQPGRWRHYGEILYTFEKEFTDSDR